MNGKNVKIPNKRRLENDDTEFSEEYTADGRRLRSTERTDTTYGWIGIVASLLSLIVWPLFTAVAGIFFGFMSRRIGAEALGNIAIAIGVLSIFIRIVI